MSRTDEYLEKFNNAAIKYGEAQNQGNSRAMDRQSKVISDIENELKSKGIDSLLVLIDNLEHENEFVRLHTALTLIPVEPNRAKDTLTELSKFNGLVAVEARIILDEWGKGNL